MLDITYQEKQFDNLSGRPPETAEYEDCIFSNCNFSGMALSGSRFIDCTFNNCNLSLSPMAYTALQGVHFNRCKMLGLRLDACDAFGLSVKFTGCILDHSSFYKLPLQKTVFTQCRLTEADFSESNLSGADFDHSDLQGAIFDHTNLEKADFRTATGFTIDPERNKMKKARFSPDGLPGLLRKYGLDIR